MNFQLDSPSFKGRRPIPGCSRQQGMDLARRQWPSDHAPIRGGTARSISRGTRRTRSGHSSLPTGSRPGTQRFRLTLELPEGASAGPPPRSATDRSICVVGSPGRWAGRLAGGPQLPEPGRPARGAARIRPGRRRSPRLRRRHARPVLGRQPGRRRLVLDPSAGRAPARRIAWPSSATT